jgi:hypothetical protein
MSWNVEFLEARRRLLESQDFRAQRALGHVLDDGTMETPVNSEVPSKVRFNCQFCGSAFRFINQDWSSDGSAQWKILEVSSGSAHESCRERRERHRAVRMT